MILATHGLLNSASLYDVNATAFIVAHEASTGISMGGVQKNAINNLYKRLKGFGTTNGSNLYSMAVSNGAMIFPLCPTNDTTASANAYKLDLVSDGVNSGIYNNFVSGDFTQNGVIGGATKWFDSGKTANQFSLTNVSHWVYIRTNSTALGYEIGTNSRILFGARASGNVIQLRMNDTTTQTVSNTDSRGFFGILRNGTTKYVVKSTTRITVGTAATVSSPTVIGFHARTDGAGNSSVESIRQLAFYIVGLNDLTQNEIDDLYYCVQQYQTEVITGGRQV